MFECLRAYNIDCVLFLDHSVSVDLLLSIIPKQPNHHGVTGRTLHAYASFFNSCGDLSRLFSQCLRAR